MPRNEPQEASPSHLPERARAAGATAPAAPLPYVPFSQRQPPPPDRRRTAAVLTLVLLAHVLLVWLGYRLLRPAPAVDEESGVITVTFIDSAKQPPNAVPPSAAAPLRVAHREAPAPGAMTATFVGEKPPPLQLFDANGQVRLPPPLPGAIGTPGFATPAPQASRISSGKSPVPYTPTQFDQAWAPLNEGLVGRTVGRAVDKAIDATTLQKTVRLPGDLKIHCVVSPLALFAGCKGDDPQAPPKNDNDIRLSLPPSETLTGKKVPLPSSATSVPPPASGSN